MPARLEIMLRPELLDAEGESVRRQAREYFALEFSRIRVIQVLTFDADLTPEELEGIRTEVFTNPVTQVSGYRPLAGHFDWAVWVGLRPGVRDNPGATGLEAVAAFLGRSLGTEAAIYTSRLYVFEGDGVSQPEISKIARELLANDIVQEFRIFSPDQWDPEAGLGLIIPKVRLDRQPTVTTLAIDSEATLKRLSGERNLALRDQDIPIIRNYYLRPEVQARRQELWFRLADGRGAGVYRPGPERPLQSQHLPGRFHLPGLGQR